jgi:hypothetical protein
MSGDLRHPYRKLFRNWVAIPFVIASALHTAQRLADWATADEVQAGCLPVPGHAINGKPVPRWVERYVFWNVH